MPILTRESTILIEFMDLVCNTDYTVVKFIMDRYNKGVNLDYFTPLYNEFKDETESYIRERLDIKFNLNPLLDYLDISKLGDGVNYIKEMDNVYHMALINNISNFESLKTTNLVSSLNSILHLKDITQIYVYYPTYSPVIQYFIKKIFKDIEKVSIITGDLTSIIQHIQIDSYFLRDICNISTVMNREIGINSVDFVVPDFRCNLIDNGITIDPDLPLPALEIYDKHNINVRIMKRPI